MPRPEGQDARTGGKNKEKAKGLVHHCEGRQYGAVDFAGYRRGRALYQCYRCRLFFNDDELRDKSDVAADKENEIMEIG